MAKYYKEKIQEKKIALLSKVIQGVIASVVVGVVILAFKSLITNITVAMGVIGAGALVVSLFLRPSYKAIYHGLICAACSGLLLLNLAPFVANIYLFDGYKAAVAKRWDIAIKNYQKALKFDPRDGELNFYTGYAYMKKKDYNKAAYYFKKSLKTKLDPSAFNNLGNVYLEQGKLKEAEEAYKDALYSQVSRMYSLNNLGAIYQKTGHLDESLKMFKEALKSSPKYTIAERNLKVVKSLINRYRYIKERYGSNFIENFFTGRSYLEYKRLNEAMESFQRASAILLARDRNLKQDLSGKNSVKLKRNVGVISQIYSILGSSFVRGGKIKEAISIYKESLQFHPRNIQQLYRYIASLYMKIGEKEKASEMLKKSRLSR